MSNRWASTSSRRPIIASRAPRMRPSWSRSAGTSSPSRRPRSRRRTWPVCPWPLSRQREPEEPEDHREFVGKRIMTSKLITRVIHRLGEGETFGAHRVAAEVNRRYRDQLKRPVDAREVSVVLRRLRDAGELHQVKPGGAAHEALFSRQSPG